MKKDADLKLSEALQAVWDALPTAYRLIIDGLPYAYARRGHHMRAIRLTSLTPTERALILEGKPAHNRPETAGKVDKPGPQGPSKG